MLSVNLQNISIGYGEYNSNRVNNLNGHDYSLLGNSNNVSKNNIGNSNDAYNGYLGRNK